MKRYSESELLKLLEKEGLKATVGEGIIFVTTNVSRWRILHDGYKVKTVMHENYRFSMDMLSNKNFKSGFHKQNIKNRSYESVFRYIKNHDKNFFNRKPSRIDLLFDSISTQRTAVAIG